MRLSIYLFISFLLSSSALVNLYSQLPPQPIRDEEELIAPPTQPPIQAQSSIDEAVRADVNTLRSRLGESNALQQRFQQESQEALRLIKGSLENLKNQVSPVRERAEQTHKDLGILWLISCTALVFFMQAGFMLLELGFARSKNAINIIMKNYLDFAIAVIVFYLVGYGLLYGKSLGGWVGSSFFMPNTENGDKSFWSVFVYQLVFCGAAATIVSGAVAERTKFVGYAILSAIMTAIIYPIYGHWAWNPEGWLKSLGFHDFAGGSVVHLVGGACALAGVIMVGPRVGRFGADGKARMIVGHNLPIAALGVFILWLGWLGFNAGSAKLATHDVGLIVMNTLLASSAGALISMVSMWMLQGRSDVGILMNGALGGLVSVTAGADVIAPTASLIIGAVAGLITTYSNVLMEKLRLDDAVGAVPVHLVNGIWGVLCVAIFHVDGFSINLLGIQALGAGVCALFAFTVGILSFFVLQLLLGIRASDTEQVEGLDFHEHSATAYPEFLTTDQHFQ